MRSIVAFAFILALFSHVQSVELSASNCFLILDGQVGFNLLPWSKTTVFQPSCNFNESISNCSVSVGFCSTYLGNAYATANIDGDVFNFTSSPQYSAVNATNASAFVVSYSALSGTSSATLNFQFVCNASQTQINSSFIVPTSAAMFNSSSYMLNYTVQSEFGCGVSLSQLLAFMSQYKFIFIPVFFILGAFFCFFGRKTFNVALFLIVAMGGFLISGSLFFQLTNITSGAATKWVIFGVCVLVGAGLGYLAIKFEKAGFFGIGLVLGVVGGFFLYQLILSPILANDENTSSSTGTIVFYVTCVVLGLIGGFLSMWLEEDIKIISTAMIGAYTMVRSVSVLIGGFPPEVQVAEGTAQFTPVAYAYLVFIIVFAVLGLYVQFKHKKEEDDDKQEYQTDNYRNNLPDYA